MADRWVGGVDGCRGGWFTLLARFDGGTVDTVRYRLCSRFVDVLELAEAPAILAVDIPIGLPSVAPRGGRDCDREARRLLGPRRSSVFSPPARATLDARNYTDALAYNRRDGPFAPGISRQAWNISAKIREVDACASPDMQGRVLECHPELAFLTLGGRPARHNKKRAEGLAERMRLLAGAYGPALPDPTRVVHDFGRDRLAPDDVIDACALTLTARHIQLGREKRVPVGDTRFDSRGLRMEIRY